MVTGILLTGTYNVGINTNGKLKTPNGTTISINDVPFVRYRFNQYGPAEMEFIQNNMKRFQCLNIIDIELNSQTCNILEDIENRELNIAKFIMIPITNEEILHGLSSDVMEYLDNLSGYEVDRIVLKDVSNNSFPEALNRFRSEIAKMSSLRSMGIKELNIGICGGPYCFSGDACLTAVRARELMAKYSERKDDVVPSANHEGKLDNVNFEGCTNTCGCIRYHVYKHDVEAPAIKKEAKETSENSSDTKEEKKETVKKEKEPKVVKPKGYTTIAW